MRKVSRDWKDKPALFETEDYEEALDKLIKAREIKEKYYKHSKKVSKTAQEEALLGEKYKTTSKVLEKLEESYLGKCAYCEEYTNPDVEHYRPKGRVEEDKQHSGYYWLAYEWSNLLPACELCNRKGAKHDKFQVQGIRVTQPTLNANGEPNLTTFLANSPTLLAERPDLLHPELDEPKEYFAFAVHKKYKGICLEALEEEEKERRAKYTIEVCKLNRQPLCLNRLAIVRDKFVTYLTEAFSLERKGIIDEKQLLLLLEAFMEKQRDKAIDKTQTHTLLQWWIANSSSNFRQLILPHFPAPQQQLLTAIAQRVWK